MTSDNQAMPEVIRRSCTWRTGGLPRTRRCTFYCQIVGKGPPGHHPAPQPLVERPLPMSTCAALNDQTAAPTTQTRHSRSTSTSSTTHCSFAPVTAGIRVVRGQGVDGVPVAPFLGRAAACRAGRTRNRRRDQGTPVRGACHDAVPAGPGEHASWDRDAVERFGRVLDWSDCVFDEFSGWFNGKTSPVQLFWHSLDLAVTPLLRTSSTAHRGRRRHAGGLLAGADLVRLLGRRRQRPGRHLLLLHQCPEAPLRCATNRYHRGLGRIRQRIACAPLP